MCQPPAHAPTASAALLPVASVGHVTDPCLIASSRPASTCATPVPASGCTPPSDDSATSSSPFASIRTTPRTSRRPVKRGVKFYLSVQLWMSRFDVDGTVHTATPTLRSDITTVLIVDDIEAAVDAAIACLARRGCRTYHRPMPDCFFAAGINMCNACTRKRMHTTVRRFGDYNSDIKDKPDGVD